MTDPDEPARILVVDDDPNERKLLDLILAQENVVVVPASTGEEALQLVALARPDLILLDVLLPGMDGFEVVAQLKSAPRTMNIPVILVTALTDREARMRGLNAGAEDFLSKPIDRAELCVRVRNLLRLKAYSDFHERYGSLITGIADLIASEARYRHAFAVAPVPLALVDGDGRWVEVNQRLCEHLGATRAELMGTPPPSRPLPTSRLSLAISDDNAPHALWVFDES